MYWNIHIKRWPPNGAGLTLTWDVLKFNSCIPSKRYGMININMRCIEIKLRCAVAVSLDGLTLTWDVLKSN